MLSRFVQSNNFVSSVADKQARDEMCEHGFTRRPLPLDFDIAHALGMLAHAAWSMPADQYYTGGTRFRTLNRLTAEIGEGGVRILPSDDNAPYVQLAKYNTALGDQPRNYAPLPSELAHSPGVYKLIAHHLSYLPLSEIGTRYTVNMHVIRFAARPDCPCDTSPSGLHKDGEKYLATHLLARCGVRGGEVVITDNERREMDRFTMRETGECYVFDDDRVWHMLTPVETLEGVAFAFRDTMTFDLLPHGWQPA